ncbi:hypothetical protein BN946_scf185002.g41 [Trametes cinnabarina]|uniref:Uncharacterized protein n=1 Tax=Pycnoporus cinnabarinus TaxID=5643 RepID=A0A060SF94_PYCCI|nr:hypothetical protein BN946_scf185002.g41 [Trametes cinnabarina]
MSTVGSVEDDSPMSPLKKLMNLRTPNHSRNTSASSLPRITQQQPPPPKQQPRPLLLNPNPFKDPLSRHGTPETAFSGSTFMSGSGSVGVARMAPGPFVHRGPTNPFVQYTGIPAQAHRPPGSQTNRLGTPQMYGRAHVYPGAPCADYAGMPERAHSATPSASSIHSMAPSIQFTDASGNTYVHPAALTPSHPSNGNDPHAAARLPPTAHLRSASDPYVRSYSAEPRIRLHGADDDVVLPNPYAGGAEIRRYGSVPHVRSGGFVGFRPQGVAHVDSPGSRVQMRDIEHGQRSPGDNSWMEAVMRAAWQR